MNKMVVSFAGAGRVAGALCREMFCSGIRISQVVSPSEEEGKKLAGDCNAEWSPEPSYNKNADLIIVAVPDHKLNEVLSSVRCHPHTVVAHTAGSYGLEVFPTDISRRGVFYPLQTFSKGRHLNFTGIPFLIEASDNEVRQQLAGLAQAIKGNVHYFTADQRRLVHLSAVFICNFTNYMLTAGSEITRKAGITDDIFEPLIRETVAKAIENGPENSQTGPAIRNDINTLKKHLELLSFSPELQNLYKVLTDSIITYYKKKKE